MKTWDIAIIGGGLIGVSLALDLRKHGAEVLLADRGEPGHEASRAAAGMIAHGDPHLHEQLKPLAAASAALYPEFLHEIEDESGMKTGLRREGAIVFLSGDEEGPLYPGARRIDSIQVSELEPKLATPQQDAILLPEMTVDPQALMAAAVRAAHHRGVSIVSGSAVTEVEITNLGVSAIVTERTRYPVRAVVNCAGAWAGQLGPKPIPVRPVKGQMLSIAARALLRHVVRLPGSVYMVPQTDGRIFVGSTLEAAGFDKRVTPGTIQALRQAAADLLPEVGEARILETWAGLRPATPDALPVMGATATPGYFVSTGHYCDGILLAPITAQIMSRVVRGEEPGFDLVPFSPARFG